MRVRVSGVVAVCGGGVRRGAGTRKKLWAFREKWGAFSEKCAGFEQKRCTFARARGNAAHRRATGCGIIGKAWCDGHGEKDEMRQCERKNDRLCDGTREGRAEEGYDRPPRAGLGTWRPPTSWVQRADMAECRGVSSWQWVSTSGSREKQFSRAPDVPALRLPAVYRSPRSVGSCAVGAAAEGVHCKCRPFFSQSGCKVVHPPAREAAGRGGGARFCHLD